MKCECRYCKKIIGDFNKHGLVAMKNRTRNYDMYYFCKTGDCLDKYLKEEKELLQGGLK